MTYENEAGGRFPGEGSGGGSLADHRARVWTPEMIERRLIDALWLWRRSPGGGTSPFAGDGPWEQAFREAPGPGSAYSWDVIKEEAEAAARRKVPLTRAEVEERDAASAMLLMVGERDRRLVVLAVAQKASGRRIRWATVRALLGADADRRALGMRYTRALATMAKGMGARRAAALSTEKAR